MKLKSFVIEFDDDKSTYRTGEKISGSIRLELNKPLPARAIRVRLRGRASAAHWTADDSAGDGHPSSAEEQLLNKTLTLWGNELADCERTSKKTKCDVLSRGEHAFAFAFVLPDATKIPPSFAHETDETDGSIEYWISATVVRPARKKDYDVAESFTVVQDLADFNRSDANSPVECEEEAYVCCCCCKSGPVRVRARLNRRAFSALGGDSILLSARVENESNRMLDGVRCTLVASVAFCAKQHTNVLRRLFGKPVAPRSVDETWVNERIEVPATSPSITNCRIIELRHHVQIDVSLPVECCDYLRVVLPILLANVREPRCHSNDDSNDDTSSSPNRRGGSDDNDDDEGGEEAISALPSTSDLAFDSEEKAAAALPSVDTATDDVRVIVHQPFSMQATSPTAPSPPPSPSLTNSAVGALSTLPSPPAAASTVLPSTSVAQQSDPSPPYTAALMSSPPPNSSSFSQSCSGDLTSIPAVPSAPPLPSASYASPAVAYPRAHTRAIIPSAPPLPPPPPPPVPMYAPPSVGVHYVVQQPPSHVLYYPQPSNIVYRY